MRRMASFSREMRSRSASFSRRSASEFLKGRPCRTSRRPLPSGPRVDGEPDSSHTSSKHSRTCVCLADHEDYTKGAHRSRQRHINRVRIPPVWRLDLLLAEPLSGSSSIPTPGLPKRTVQSFPVSCRPPANRKALYAPRDRIESAFPALRNRPCGRNSATSRSSVAANARSSADFTRSWSRW